MTPRTRPLALLAPLALALLAAPGAHPASPPLTMRGPSPAPRAVLGLPGLYTFHRVDALAISPDGKTVAAGLEYEPLMVWNLRTKKRRALGEDLDDAIDALAFAPKGGTLAAAGGQGRVTLWDLATEKYRLTPAGHRHLVCALGFSPDGTRLASGSMDRTAALWDAGRGKLLFRLKAHKDTVGCVAFSPNGKLLATGSGDRTIMLWDASTGVRLRVLKGHEDSVNVVRFAPDGKTLISGSRDGTTRFWRLPSGRVIRTLPRALLAATSDARVGVVPGEKFGTLALIRLRTGRRIGLLRDTHLSHMTVLAFSPDRKTLVSGGDEGAIQLWDVATLVRGE
jgi:WD40 repeat protein